MIKAPVVAQSPVVQRLCMAEQGGRSVSHDTELEACGGGAALLAQGKLQYTEH